MNRINLRNLHVKSLLADVKRNQFALECAGKFYLVVIGVEPGIYLEWSGNRGAEKQVKGYPGAVYKSFKTIDCAVEWLSGLED